MTEHPNAVACRQAIRDYMEGNMTAFYDVFDPDMVWHVAGKHPVAGDYKGTAEILRYFDILKERSIDITPENILASDSHIVVFLRMRGQHDGKTLDILRAQCIKVGPDGRWTEFWSLANDQRAEDVYFS
jgi:ketosteroid isomerase-like protein